MLVRARAVAKRSRSGVPFEFKHELTTRLKAKASRGSSPRISSRAIREITEDMTSRERMHRLLMGDVGTGKTVVALFAMLLAVENDFQAALMAPTELLAEQHGATLTTLVDRSRSARAPPRPADRAEKAARRNRLASGEARMVVGTHALLQEGVRPAAGPGGDRRAASVRRGAAGGVGGKGAAPDVLLLTATPIPRSLALTALRGPRRHGPRGAARRAVAR